MEKIEKFLERGERLIKSVTYSIVEAIGAIIAFIAFCYYLLDSFGIFDAPEGTIRFWLSNKASQVTLTLLAGFVLDTIRFRSKLKLNSDLANKQLRQEKKKSFDIFISSPITSFSSFEQYKSFQKTCLKVIGYLRQLPRSVYYKGELVKSADSFRTLKVTSSQSRPDSLEALKKSKKFIAIFPDKELLTSAIVEIGFALGKGLKCIIYYKNAKYLPAIIRETGGSCWFFRYEKTKDIIKSMKTSKTISILTG